MKRLKVVLHPTDFSPNSEVALSMACKIARHHEAKLIVLHVTHPVPCHWPRVGHPILHSCEHWRVANLRLRSLGCADLWPERMLKTGEPATVVVRVAKKVGADLIVVGQPRPGQWRWLFEERVAQTVVRRAACPVLVAGPTANAIGGPTVSGQSKRDSAAFTDDPLAADAGRNRVDYELHQEQVCGAIGGRPHCWQTAARWEDEALHVQ